VNSYVDEAKRLIQSGQEVAASVAPSFAAQWGGVLAGRLPSALRQLGFKHVCETAEGAKYITEKALSGEEFGNVCTACPVVINYIEMYKPDLMDVLIPVTSPMIAHGRMLKENYPGCAVVFIGPCAAKASEAQRPENTGAIDCVITFAELQEWLKEENIDPNNCSESTFENIGQLGESRLFPIQGGMLKTGGVASDGTDSEVIHISGAEDVMGLLDSEDLSWRYRYVEPLFCKGGCINGPAFPDGSNVFDRRNRVIEYAKKPTLPSFRQRPEISFTAYFTDESKKAEEVSETQINKVYERTGKIDPQSRLNCGACGYDTCLENAVAVARGLAEPEMCMPYMRRLAQQRTDRIIETTPNGVVVLDSELCMIKMNPAFMKMFMCNNGILGRRISYLVNSDGYEKMLAGLADDFQSIQSKYGIRYHEHLYALREDKQYVGIYADISKIKYDEGQMDIVKTQTLMHAREFLDHQIRFAQEMAHYLGKSTAQSEEIANRLISLYEEDDGAK
jgi:uncharacterized Fe-S cluster-containing protein